MTKGTGQMFVGGSASVDAAPARNAIRIRHQPRASTIVWARRLSVTTGGRISTAPSWGESLTDSSLVDGMGEPPARSAA